MSEKSSQIKLVYIILAYLIPVFGWISYTYFLVPLVLSWTIALTGLILLFFGSTFLFFLLKAEPRKPLNTYVASPEPIIVEKIINEPPTAYLEKIEELQKAIDERAVSLDNKDTELSHLLLENQEIKNKLCEVIESSALKDEEARRKIESLEHEMHQKAQTSKFLENQIHDLRYEIKTLLQLTEVDCQQQEKEELVIESSLAPASSLICSIVPQESAKGLLTRCINIAQKMTAGYHSSSMRHLSSDPYAFDLRRLSDALRQEMGALIVVYSPKEERVLFSNAASKNLLGLSPEQFSQDFTDYIGMGISQWKSGVLQLLTKSDVCMSIDFQTKNHDIVPMKVLLGSVPTGVFRSLVIGVLQEA